MIPRLSDETLKEAVAALQMCGSTTKAAKELGIPTTTFISRIERAAKRGFMPLDAVMPGFEIAKVSETQDADGKVKSRSVQQKQAPQRGEAVPPGHAIKGMSTLLDGSGRVAAQWVKTRAELDPLAIVEALKQGFAEFKPFAPSSAVPYIDFSDQLALYPWADPHFGLYSWRGDAAENWDLKIAVRVVRDTFRRVVERTPPTRQAMLLVGGDTLHADSQENRTPGSGNQLDVDGRFPKVLLTACETIVHNTDLLLTNHEKVDLVVIPGNHDKTAAHAISFFLHAWYRNEPRVSVDTSPSLFRFREFGQVMLATTHGHEARGKDIAGVMAAREAALWGRTKHRYAHLFHVHHSSKMLSEGGGVICETHQIIAPQDAWHFGQGFVSGRSLQSICYDREHGEVSRARVAVF